MSLAITIQTTWAMLPDDMRASVPLKLVAVITIGLLVLGIIGRLIKQKDPVTPLTPPSE